MPLPREIERVNYCQNFVMKNSYATTGKYITICLLLLYTLTGWSQSSNLKYLTAQPFDTLPKGNHKGIATKLTIRPAAKAMLDKVAQNSDSTKKRATPQLRTILDHTNLSFPMHSKANRLKYKQQKDLIISKNKQDVPIFIKGKQNQILTPTTQSNSRSANYSIIATDFLIQYKDLLQLNNPTTAFKEKEVIADPQGNIHIKLQQYWKEIPIWNSQVIVHANTKGVYAFNGRYHPNMNLPNQQPTISGVAAIEIVKQFLGVEKCSLPTDLKTLLSTETQQAAELVYYVNPSAKTPKLAWKIEIHTTDLAHWLLMVDAIDGHILYKKNQICHFNGPTTARAKDLNGVTQTIHTYDNGNSHYLVDGSRSMFDPTSIIPNEEKGAIVTLDARLSDPENLELYNIASSNNTWTDQTAVSAHHHAGICYDYFRTTFNRNSIDGKGGNIYSIINFDIPDNAFWSGTAMFYGYGETGFRKGSVARALDISAHEMTHGIIRSSANLVYEFQSGALNESFADVFGVMVDRDNWTLGEDIVNPQVYKSGTMRNLANPNNGVSIGKRDWQPDHMSQYVNLEEDEDYGGVHINSGIPNHAFYLFATAIGKKKAEQVYYKALTQYLTPTSQFIDCRLAVIAAAEELYSTSEATAAAAAFDAVGIIGDSGTKPTEDLPKVEGLQYILTQTTYQGKSIIGEIDIQKETYRIKSNHEFRPRLNVEETGQLAVFVGMDRNVYLIDLTDDNPTTNTELLLEALEDGTTWHKVAISRDAKRIALLAYPYEPRIIFFDYDTEEFHEFEIYSSASESGVIASPPERLDIIHFDPTSQYIIYDAYNKPTTSTGFWDIGIIEVWNNTTQSLGDGTIWKPFTDIPSGYSVGNPIFSNTSSNRIAFEMFAEEEGEAPIYTLDLHKNKLELITVNTLYSDYSLLGFPCFAPNDDYIAYVTDKGEDQNYVTFQQLDSDHITPIGNNQGIYFGEFPMWYARGQRNFSPPAAAFSANIRSGEAPLTVNFKEESTNNPLTWSWVFEGGTPSQSDERNPVVTYMQPGRYKVQLTVSNDAGQDTEIKTSYIEVLEATPSITCSYPTGLTATNYGYSHFQLVWDDISDGSAYRTRIRRIDGDWIVGNISSSSTTNWVGNTPCTTYEIQVRSECTEDGTTVESNYSPSIFVTTTGCEDTYCYSYGLTWDDWIDKITLNTLNYKSGNDFGYANYTNKSTILEREKEYNLIITPGFKTTGTSNVHYSAWIDFNQDNDFEDNGERIMTTQHNNTQTLQTSISIPSTAKLGSTRMRIALNKDRTPNPCDVREYSEVEDYTVHIENSIIPSTLTVSKTQFDLPAIAGTTDFSITSNTSWSLRSNDSWIKFSPTSGTNNGSITINYEANPTTLGRSAIISVSGDGVPAKTISLTQAGISSTNSSEPTWEVIPSKSSSNHTIIIPANLQSEEPCSLSAGDWIGFFFNDNGQTKCASYSEWLTTKNSSLAIFGDDTDTPIKDGYATGEPFILKIWKKATGEEIMIQATFSPTNAIITDAENFSQNGISELATITCDNRTGSMSFNLEEGWNTISSNIVPTEKNMLNIVAPIADEVIIIKNGASETALPTYGINNIGNWNELEGYQIKVSEATNFILDGQAVNSSVTIPIKEGWQIIPYYPTQSQDIAQALASIEPQIIMVKDNWGNTYIPDLDINNIGDAQPNQGYLLNASAATSLVYNNFHSTDHPSTTQRKAITKYQHFVGSRRNTGNNASLLLPKSVSNKFLTTNDEIGIFTKGGLLCGAGIVTNEHLVITIWGDDPSTDLKDGLFNEESFIIKHWNSTTLQEQELAATFKVENPVYKSNDIYVIHDLTIATPTKTAPNLTATLFPNPTAQKCTIQLKEKASADITGVVVNRNRQVVKQLLIQQGAIATHIDLGSYPTGVYWIQLNAEKFSIPAIKLVIIE